MDTLAAPPPRGATEPPELSLEERAWAEELAARLGETEKGPRWQVRRIVRVIGTERAAAFEREAGEIERAGGMMLPRTAPAAAPPAGCSSGLCAMPSPFRSGG